MGGLPWPQRQQTRVGGDVPVQGERHVVVAAAEILLLFLNNKQNNFFCLYNLYLIMFQCRVRHVVVTAREKIIIIFI